MILSWIYRCGCTSWGILGCGIVGRIDGREGSWVRIGEVVLFIYFINGFIVMGDYRWVRIWCVCLGYI